MAVTRFYSAPLARTTRYVNVWDVCALLLVIGVLSLIAWTTRQMATPYQLGQALPMSLEPGHLPTYAARTVMRIAIALFFSLLFTFTFGTWAAKSERAAAILLPLIDVLQSVPVLSFLAISVVAFIALFPNSLLGPECASIFAIFTSQAWNMVLGFYQSLRTVPHDLREAASMFHLSAWQRFWRIEVPFSMPSLLWNTMMSLSASWFFVVASEAISVAKQDIRLPGIGSYIVLAIEKADLFAVGYAILTMFLVILIYDQLIFRPLIAWSERFKWQLTPDDQPPASWFLDVLERTQLVRKLSGWISAGFGWFFNLTPSRAQRQDEVSPPKKIKHFGAGWYIVLVISIAAMGFLLGRFIFASVPLIEVAHVFLLGLITALRVFVLIIIASIIWIPIGVWIGRRPFATAIAQPIIQFLAAFPAYLLFPVVVILIVKFNLNVEVWVTPLMILGSQWYILFNVIAGVASIPKDLYQVAANFGVTGWQWWRRLILPGIFPYFITGVITAAGGAWNASIVAEVVTWGNTTLHATGLGAYITKYTNLGDFPRIALGTAAMCILVLVFNRILWRPLYHIAESRYQLL
ncbi:MAG: ABC transporter permease subunit [Gammaproteobacteria bacterium]